MVSRLSCYALRIMSHTSLYATLDVAMATVTGSGVKAAREETGLSQRKLARRVAERLGDPERATALGVMFSRLERRGNSELEAGLAQLIGEELGVGVRDLQEGVLYTWARRLEGGAYTFPALGLRQLVWTSHEAAFDGRDAITKETLPFKNFDLNIARGASLVPVFREALRRTMEAHFGDLTDNELERRLVVDPSARAIRELATAQVALGAQDAEDRRAAGQAWAQAAAEGILETAGPDELFNLTERRAARGDDPDLGEVPDELLAQWDRERAALAETALEYLSRRDELLRGRRTAG